MVFLSHFIQKRDLYEKQRNVMSGIQVNWQVVSSLAMRITFLSFIKQLTDMGIYKGLSLA